MTDRQKEAIKNMTDKNLLDLFCNYHYKLVTAIVDDETNEIHHAILVEILNRMQKGA